MSSAESHGNPAFLTASRLTIFNESDHLLVARVATSLLEQLKADSPFNEISYFPHGEQAETGKLAPDLYLTLNLRSIDESGLIGRDLKAIVTASLGTSFASANYSRTDDQSPPTVNMRGNIEVDHESSMVGVESSAAKYVLQGNDIAKQISKHVLDKINKLRDKHSPLPDLPEALYPEWTPEPDFAFLDRLQAARLSGVHCLMLHNESTWKYLPTGDPIETVTKIRDELLAEGWTENNFHADKPEHFNLYMMKDDATLTVFPQRRSGHARHLQIVNGDGADATKPTPSNHYVRYQHRQSTAEIRKVVDSLFAEERPDINLLLAMQKNWQGSQHSEAVSLIEERGIRSLDAWLLVARSYSKRKDVEGTRRALACCQFLTQTMTDAGDANQRIKKIAKEQQIDEKQLARPDREMLTKLGFVALDPESTPAGTTTVRFGEPAAFYVIDEDEKLTVISFTVDKPPQGDRYRIITLEAAGGMRSWTIGEHSSFEHLGSRTCNGHIVRPHVEQKTPDTLEFQLTMVPRARQEESASQNIP